MKTQSKQDQLNLLYEQYRKKESCPFDFTDINNSVLGYGNPESPILFVGEAPGRDEDLQGKPFVGRSGQLLNKVLEAANTRREDVFITNVVKWRPPHNRQPTLAEMETAKNLILVHEINIIKPKVICTLGASALYALLDPGLKISRVRGTAIQKDGIIYVPTYHPAYILRNNKELEHFMHDIFNAITLSK